MLGKVNDVPHAPLLALKWAEENVLSKLERGMIAGTIIVGSSVSRV